MRWIKGGDEDDDDESGEEEVEGEVMSICSFVFKISEGVRRIWGYKSEINGSMDI